jgi:hypothetical protein
MRLAFIDVPYPSARPKGHLTPDLLLLCEQVPDSSSDSNPATHPHAPRGLPATLPHGMHPRALSQTLCLDLRIRRSEWPQPRGRVTPN